MSQNRLIVALDHLNDREAVHLSQRLAPHVGMVKVGLELFVAYGPRLVRELRHLGVDVFLDLKLHDIPNQVAGAARAVSDLDVRLLTIHAAGGAAMVRQARDFLAPQTKLIAVTMLTSLDDDAVASLGFKEDAKATALTLGRLAIDNGADGLVSSAHELPLLQQLPGLRVVPGIRPSGADVGDQKRVATPRDAVKAGATWLVVGRPITQATDPVAAAMAISQEVVSE